VGSVSPSLTHIEPLCLTAASPVKYLFDNAREMILARSVALFDVGRHSEGFVNFVNTAVEIREWAD
jgi:hypothetical protein